MTNPVEYGVIDPITKKQLRMVLQFDYAQLESKYRFYKAWIEHLIAEQQLCRWDDCDFCRDEEEIEALR